MRSDRISCFLRQISGLVRPFSVGRIASGGVLDRICIVRYWLILSITMTLTNTGGWAILVSMLDQWVSAPFSVGQIDSGAVIYRIRIVCYWLILSI